MVHGRRYGGANTGAARHADGFQFLSPNGLGTEQLRVRVLLLSSSVLKKATVKVRQLLAAHTCSNDDHF